MTPEERNAIDAYLSAGGQVYKAKPGESAEVLRWCPKSKQVVTVQSIYKKSWFGFGDPKAMAKAQAERTLAAAKRRAVVIEMNAAGKTNQEIAAELGVSTDTVRKDIVRLKLKSNVSYVPRGVGPEVMRLLEEGYSVSKIAATLGIAKGTVEYHNRKRRAG